MPELGIIGKLGKHRYAEPAVIGAVFILLYLATINTIPQYDPVRNLVVSQETQMRGIPTYFDSAYWQHPPLLNYMIAFVSSITGLHVYFSGNAVILLLSFFSLFVFYELCMELRDRKDRNFARIATIVLGVMPVFWVWSNQIMHEVPQTFFFIATIYSFYMAVKQDKKLYFYASGLFFALGLLLKMENVIVLPVMMVFAVAENGKGVFGKRFILNIIAMFVVSGLVFSPYFLYRSVNGAPSFFGERAFSEIVTGEAAWAEGGSIATPFYYYVTSIFDIISFGVIFFAIGLYCFYRKRDRYMWLPLIWMCMSYLILSIFSHKEYRYMIIAIPAMVMISVYGLYSLKDRYLKNKRHFYALLLILVIALGAHSVYKASNDGYWPLNWKMWDDLKGMDNIVLSTDLYKYSTVDVAYGVVKLMSGKYSDFITGDPQKDLSFAMMYNTPYLLYVGKPEFSYPFVKLKYFEECNCTLYKIDERFLFENKTLVKTTSGGVPLEGANVYLVGQDGKVLYRSRSNIRGEIYIPADSYTGVVIAEKICYTRVQTYINIENRTLKLCELKQKAGVLGMAENYLECRLSEGIDLAYRGCFDHEYGNSRF
jgi:hypothetical protein